MEHLVKHVSNFYIVLGKFVFFILVLSTNCLNQVLVANTFRY